MKNNQFRAYISKYIQKAYNAIVLAVDIDSNLRKVYLYTKLTGDCIGSFSLYFTNDYVNIAYSKRRTSVCRILNTKDEKQFDYCRLKEAICFLDEAVKYFIEGGKDAEN